MLIEKIKSKQNLVYAKILSEFNDVPSILYYDFKHFKPRNDISDSFVIALLPFAMHHNENIIVKHPVSEGFIRQIHNYQKKLVEFFPRLYKEVAIKAKSIKIKKGTKSTCSFSGGIDSFYSILKLEPDYALFINGRDIKHNSQKFTKIANHYKKILSKKGISLITVKTNVRDFTPNIKGYYTFGPEIISAGLFTGSANFYVPSSYDIKNLKPCSSHPDLDYILSNNRTNIIHHGANTKRIDKTKELFKHPETYDSLRVCEDKSNLYNCCICEKCIRTMIFLEAHGNLKKYTSFPNRPTPAIIRKTVIQPQNRSFYKEIIEITQRKKEIKYALARSRIAVPLNIIIKNIWNTSDICKIKYPYYKKFIRIIKFP